MFFCSFLSKCLVRFPDEGAIDEFKIICYYLGGARCYGSGPEVDYTDFEQSRQLNNDVMNNCVMQSRNNYMMEFVKICTGIVWSLNFL